ncbi:hypothetical protein bcere0007_52260 [Bacillus mycoides]|nr:hypothetical protein bcere0007_52260 [Bacillus mycoides]
MHALPFFMYNKDNEIKVNIYKHTELMLNTNLYSIHEQTYRRK